MSLQVSARLCVYAINAIGRIGVCLNRTMTIISCGRNINSFMLRLSYVPMARLYRPRNHLSALNHRMKSVFILIEYRRPRYASECTFMHMHVLHLFEYTFWLN